MKKQTMRARGMRLSEDHYAHLQKKAGKNGTPSAANRDLIEADMKKEAKKK